MVFKIILNMKCHPDLVHFITQKLFCSLMLNITLLFSNRNMHNAI